MFHVYFKDLRSFLSRSDMVNVDLHVDTGRLTRFSHTLRRMVIRTNLVLILTTNFRIGTLE